MTELIRIISYGRQEAAQSISPGDARSQSISNHDTDYAELG